MADVKNLLEAEPAMEEVLQLLVLQPSSTPVAASGPDIPSLCEQLAILVSTGKLKEAIGIS